MTRTRLAVFLGALVLAFSITLSASGSPSAPSLIAISAGSGHTCVVTSVGGVKCWGSNRYGQLGNGASRCNVAGVCSKRFSRTAVDVVGLSSPIQAVAAGGTHTCALTRGGGVKCWGYNARGQLGNGQKPCGEVDTCTKHASSTPVDVVGLSSGVRAIAAGEFYACALTHRGGVKCWGLGPVGPTYQSSIPVDVVGLTTGVREIPVDGYPCAITTEGGVKCWSGGGEPLVGVVDLASGVRALSGSVTHACALTSAGGVQCWGSNRYGELGNGTRTESSTPVDVVGLANGAAAITAGSGFTCALTTKGGVKCWGIVLGSGSSTGNSTPVDVAGLASGVRAITSGGGGGFSCALVIKGGAKCWGYNFQGRLGNGSKATASTKPVDVVFSATPSAKPPSSAGPGASAFKTGYFKTPSGNIVCFHSPGPADLPRPFLACGIRSGLKPAPPRRPCQDGGYAGDRVSMFATGSVSVPDCAGDPGALVGESRARVLGYGKTWSGGGLRCTSAFTGLTCRNKSGHGFFLSRERWRRF